MAQLNPDPKGWELEDLVAAHFVSRGCYVETGVKERSPDELLELDLVWTDYTKDPQVPRPVEVKSGDWGLGDVFKFFGWTRYIGLEPGQFVHKEPCGRLDPDSLTHVARRTGIAFLPVRRPEEADTQFKTLGLPDPTREELPEIWRYSFWCQRRLLKSLNEAIKKGLCPETLRAAKQYYQLVNDAVFFVQDVRDRVGLLLSAHLDHPALAASAAHELETGRIDFTNPPQTETFKRAYYRGEHFPIQACLYLAHRARLYILKAVVDYWLARERGDIKKLVVKLGDALIDLTAGKLSAAMAAGINELAAARSLRRFPVFWQTFLWSWGGFVLKDRLDQEYDDLSKETAVPVAEIPLALSAFDKLFPTPGGWFREPDGDSRKLLVLMPPTLRGLGAFRRRVRANVDQYSDLGYKDSTSLRLMWDNNTCVRHLECADADLTT